MTTAGYSPWSDLNSELLVSIAAADGVSLRDYASLRGVCTAWRSALAPLSYPCLLSVAEGHDSHSASVFSLSMGRSFHLHTGSSVVVDPKQSFYGRARVVGSANGRFAIAINERDTRSATRRTILVDPRAGKKVQLVFPTRDKVSVCKIVFASNTNLNPRSHNDHWRAVALYDNYSRVAFFIDTGGSSSTEDKKWTTVDVTDGSCYDDMAFHAGRDKVYFLSSRGSVHVLRMPHGGQPAVIEPLATLMRDPNTNPTATYAAPYNVVSQNMVTKHIFFCHGSLYQVWKNTNATVNLGSGYFRMSAHEIFVLRYVQSRRWPRWDVVKDLGGCSVFLSKSSSPAVVRPAVPEVRADCVYWIDWRGVPMVCDIATGASKPWVLPNGTCIGDCWYFSHDDTTSTDRDGRN